MYYFYCYYYSNNIFYPPPPSRLEFIIIIIINEKKMNNLSRNVVNYLFRNRLYNSRYSGYLTTRPGSILLNYDGSCTVFNNYFIAQETTEKNKLCKLMKKNIEKNIQKFVFDTKDLLNIEKNICYSNNQINNKCLLGVSSKIILYSNLCNKELINSNGDTFKEYNKSALQLLCYFLIIGIIIHKKVFTQNTVFADGFENIENRNINEENKNNNDEQGEKQQEKYETVFSPVDLNNIKITDPIQVRLIYIYSNYHDI